MGDVHIVHLRGEIDLAVSDEVLATLVALPGSTVVADLSGATFCDASALRAFVRARREVLQRGHGFRIEGARGIVRRVFTITGLDDLLQDEH